MNEWMNANRLSSDILFDFFFLWFHVQIENRYSLHCIFRVHWRNVWQGIAVWMAATHNNYAINLAIHHSNHRLETINCLFEIALYHSKSHSLLLLCIMCVWIYVSTSCGAGYFHELCQVLMSFYVFTEKIIIDLIIN